MAYAVSQEFTQKLYSGECNYRATLTIGEQTIDNDQIASISISSPIVDSSTQTFYIGTFISQKIKIKFKTMEGINVYSGEQVDLSIGQYVNNAWVDVPIGKFLIDDLAEDYYKKCEITCLDYAVKFKPNIDYSPCFVDGKANIKTILEYICEQFDVELGDYPSINDNIEVGTYDSTVSGKQWISYIAELKGCNAKMDRNGRLTLQPLKQASNVSINALESASFELGEKYNITKVTFFDALRNYTYGDDEGNTLFIRQDNPFVDNEKAIENVYNSICTEKLSAEGKYIDIEDADANDIDLVEIDGETSQETYTGKNLLNKLLVDDALRGYNESTQLDTGLRVTCKVAGGYRYSVIPIEKSDEMLGKKVTWSADLTYSGTNNAQMSLYFINKDTYQLSNIIAGVTGTSAKLSKTATVPSTYPENASGIGLLVYSSQTQTTVGQYVEYRNLQVEYGETVTSYEKYVGSRQSPNPDYPQKVNVVYGDNNVVVFGKNLFDKNNANIINGYISKASQNIVSNTNDRIVYIPCKPNTTYTISKMVEATASNNRFALANTSVEPQISTTVSNITFLPNGTTKKSLSITTNSTANYLVCGIYHTDSATTFGDMLDSIQIEKGSTATTYEAYNDTTYSINLPVENVFNYENTDNYVNSGNSNLTKIDGGIRIATTTGGVNRFASIILGKIEDFIGKPFSFSCNMTPSSTNDPAWTLFYMNSNKGLMTEIGSVRRNNFTYTIPSTIPTNAYYLALVLYNNRSTYVEGATTDFTNIQIEYGEKVNTYTPFGVVPIGTNIFDKNNYGILNAWFSSGTTTITSSNTNRLVYIPCEPYKTYTLSKINTNYTSFGYTTELPAIGVSVWQAVNTANNPLLATPLTITTGASAKYLVARLGNFAQMTVTVDEVINSIRIEEGYISHIDEKAIELCNVNYKDNIFKTTGKNLLTLIPNISSGLTAYVNPDGSINIKGTATTSGNISICRSVYKHFDAGKYTLTVTPEYDRSLYVHFWFYDGTSQNIMQNATSTFISDMQGYDVRINVVADTTYDLTFKMQLEKGDTSTAYEPPDSKDEWYLCKYCNHEILNSNYYTGKANVAAANHYRYYVTAPNAYPAPLASENPKIYSNIGTNISRDDAWFERKYGFSYINGNRLQLVFKETVATTIDEFKSWLDDKQPEVYYYLANEQYTKITYQPLIDQLNAIDEEASLFEGTNHITIEPSDETPSLKINYYKNSNFELYSLKTHNYGDFTLDAWDNINYQLGDKNYLTLNNNDIKYEMSIMGDVNTKIPTKQQEVTTNIIGGDDKTNIKKIKTNVDVLNAEATILSQQQTTTANNLSELTVNVNGISSSVSTIQNSTIPSINGDINAINNDIDGINTTINNQNTTINNITSRLSSVEQTAETITNMFQISGGINIIRNSAFLLSDALWEFTNSGSNPYYTPLGTSYNATLSGTTTSVAEIKLRSIKVKSKSENITNLKIGTKYTFNFYHKQDANITTTIKMYSTEDNTSKAFNDIVITGQQSLKNYEVSFTPTTYANYTLEIIVANTDNIGYSYIYDMMLNTGDKQSWQPASDEIYSTTLSMSRLGLQVYSVGDGTITLLGSEGLLSYETSDGKTKGNLVSKRTLDGDLVRSTTTQALYVTPNIADVIEHPNTPKWVNTTSMISGKLTYIEYLESGE